MNSLSKGQDGLLLLIFKYRNLEREFESRVTQNVTFTVVVENVLCSFFFFKSLLLFLAY